MKKYGKLDFAVSFQPMTAFPIDGRCYFENLSDAKSAASSAKEVGSTDTVYYYGMKLLVDDGETVKWYTIQRDNTLSEENTVVGDITDVNNVVEF